MNAERSTALFWYTQIFVYPSVLKTFHILVCKLMAKHELSCLAKKIGRGHIITEMLLRVRSIHYLLIHLKRVIVIMRKSVKFCIKR